MDSPFSLKDEIWFLQVCHHMSNAVYFISCNECAYTSFQSLVTQILQWNSDSAECEDAWCIVVLWTGVKCFGGILCLHFKDRTGKQTGNWPLDVGTCRLMSSSGWLDQKMKRGGRRCKGGKQVINSEEKMQKEKLGWYMFDLQLCCVPGKTTEDHLFHHRVSSLSSATHPASFEHPHHSQPETPSVY